jgi:AcrR family transcriptional regulator
MPSKKYHHGDLKNALIRAGADILAKEGLGGISLRKVAKRAGVSHSAPYAHFKDRQSLIAAISTEGFRQLYEQLNAAFYAHADDPEAQLVESAWAYIQFALNNADTFKIMFSGVLEKEKDYPSFVEISGKTFERVVKIVQVCQHAGVLGQAPSELVAVSLWGQVHGIISLVLEGQITHRVLDRFTLRDILLFAISQMSYER